MNKTELQAEAYKTICDIRNLQVGFEQFRLRYEKDVGDLQTRLQKLEVDIENVDINQEKAESPAN